MTSLVLIAALDRNRAIGRGNDLPWRLPADLRRFKQLTLGRPLLMGRKTAQSLGRALPGRRNLVLSRNALAPFEGMEAMSSLEQALDAIAGEELVVIGGGEIYRLTLPLATRLHLTHVDAAVADADAFFPAFEPSQWRVTARERHDADERHAHGFEFVDYAREAG